MQFERVLPDTNVCYPLSLLDLMLRMDEEGLHQIVWSQDLLRELEATWVRNGARDPTSARRICDAIRAGFAPQEIPRADYEKLIDEMPGRDPDDRVHAAAAATVAPVTIVTRNTRDFPAAALAERGVTVRTPDDYLARLLVLRRAELAQVVIEMAADRSRPKMTPPEVLDALERAGVPRFANLLQREMVLGLDGPSSVRPARRSTGPERTI